MAFQEKLFGYSDLLACLELLRRRRDTRPIAHLIALIAQYALEVDVKAALRYLRWKGWIRRGQKGSHPAFELAAPCSGDPIVELKQEKSARRWDGTWTVLTYDVPESQRMVRRRMTRLLHRTGFAMVSKSSWISPYEWRDVFQDAVLRWPSDGTFSYIRSTDVSMLGETSELDPAELWRLDEIRNGHVRIIDVCRRTSRHDSEPGRRSRARALMIAVKAWRLINVRDPMLPRPLLPAAWSREEADRWLGELASRVARDAEGRE